ncbi:MAG: hypothetical protein VKK63_12220, partial [Synechococcus sp.]|nr:hypothetical protein [Synechococcus sp.]
MKLIYDTTNNTLLPWPRIDDEPVIGLAPHLLEVTVIQEPQPPFNPATERLEKTETIDTATSTATRGWSVIAVSPPAFTAEEWVAQFLSSTQLIALADLRLDFALRGLPLTPLMQQLRDWTTSLMVAWAADPTPKSDWTPAPCSYESAS